MRINIYCCCIKQSIRIYAYFIFMTKYTLCTKYDVMIIIINDNNCYIPKK